MYITGPSLLKLDTLPLLPSFLIYVAMVTGGGLSAILSAGVWDFSLESGGHGNGNEAILNRLQINTFSFSFFPFSRQLQHQQQTELEGGGARDGLFEAGPITLSQVRLSTCVGT